LKYFQRQGLWPVLEALGKPLIEAGRGVGARIETIEPRGDSLRVDA
jgi:hypothetical protein